MDDRAEREKLAREWEDRNRDLDPRAAGHRMNEGARALDESLQQAAERDGRDD